MIIKLWRKETDGVRLREADLTKRISDLEIKNDTLEESLCHVHEKINAVYIHEYTYHR